MPLMASSTPCVMDADELGFRTRIRVDRRTKFVVMVILGRDTRSWAGTSIRQRDSNKNTNCTFFPDELLLSVTDRSSQAPSWPLWRGMDDRRFGVPLRGITWTHPATTWHNCGWRLTDDPSLNPTINVARLQHHHCPVSGVSSFTSLPSSPP